MYRLEGSDGNHQGVLFGKKKVLDRSKWSSLELLLPIQTNY